MFLHLGGEVIIPTSTIVAIIDVETRVNSDSTQEFLAVAEDEGFVIHLSEKPNSFVITEDKIYLSPISAATLKKRTLDFTKF